MTSLAEKDAPTAIQLFKEIKKASGECLQNLKVLNTRIKECQNCKAEGLSFLSVKNSLMSSYLANLGQLMDRKTAGQGVGGHPAVDRLVEIRTVLEKMRPMEHKLKYQINKVVSAYKEGKTDPSDPRKFKAKFGSFSNTAGGDGSDESDGEKEDAEEKPKEGLYKAPKLAPVHYSDDETAEERTSKAGKAAARKALGSAMLREIREQYTDAPIEVQESRDVHRMKDNKRDRERTEYEEANFVRVAVSRKESTAARRIGTMSALGTLADFDSFGNTEGGPPKKKKKGLQGKGKKGKGFGKKKGGKKHKR